MVIAGTQSKGRTDHGGSTDFPESGHHGVQSGRAGGDSGRSPARRSALLLLEVTPARRSSASMPSSPTRSSTVCAFQRNWIRRTRATDALQARVLSEKEVRRGEEWYEEVLTRKECSWLRSALPLCPPSPGQSRTAARSVFRPRRRRPAPPPRPPSSSSHRRPWVRERLPVQKTTKKQKNNQQENDSRSAVSFAVDRRRSSVLRRGVPRSLLLEVHLSSRRSNRCLTKGARSPSLRAPPP